MKDDPWWIVVFAILVAMVGVALSILFVLMHRAVAGGAI